MLASKGSTSATPGSTASADGALGSVTPDAGSGAAGSNLGVQAFYGLESFQLDKINGLQAQVNLFTGNLVVHSTDLAINGPGLNLRLDRFFNSKASGLGAFGTNSVLSTGQDVGLQIVSGSVTFTGPSGFTAKFTGNGPSYTTPAGINATLVKNSDGTYSLTYNKTSEKLTFTSGGYLTKDADKNGNALTLGYNPDNTLASITDTVGRVTTFNYDSGHISSIVDPADREIDYTYSGNNLTNMVNTTEGGSGATYTYNASNQLISIDTPAGSNVDFGYDTQGRLSTLTQYTVDRNLGKAETTTFAYPNSTTTTEKDPAGSTTTYTLDTSGRVTSVKDALGRTRSETYTANDNVQTAVDAMGTGSTHTTTFSYDSNNNVKSVAIPTGAAAQAQYANSTTAPTCSSSDTTHPYLPKCIEDSQNRQTSMTYDGAGNATTVKDTTSGTNSGVSDTYTYQGDSGVSCGGHKGQVCSSTNGNGNKTTYSYDSNGDLTKVTPPSPGTVTTYGYDSLSRLTSVSTPRIGLVTYDYDAADQLLDVLLNGIGQTPGDLSYGYDDDGDVTSQTRYNDRSTTYLYDGMDRETDNIVDGEANSSVTYNDAGDVATYTVDGSGTSADGTVTYGYDADNEVTSLAENGGSCTAPVSMCTTFAYTNDGARKTTTYPGNTVQTVSYDNSSRPTEVKAVHGSTVLSDFTYSYTLSSKDTALVQTRTDKLGVGGPANSTTTYSYDTLARLTGAVEKTSAGATNASWTYAYDKDGNRTSNSATLSGHTTTTSQGYNAIDELTTLAGSSSGLSYDTDGNETSNPGNPSIGVATRTNETANAFEQLTSITAGGTAVSYDYDGQDNSSRFQDGGLTQYDDMLGLAYQTDSTETNTTSFIRTPDGTLIGENNGTTTQYFLADNLGSVVGTVDGTGTKTASYAYDPYGRTRSASGSNASANPYQYAGGYLDSNTGLVKFGARYYDANVGRFTQPDPSGQEPNRYAYAGNQPVNAGDPQGTSSCGDFGSVLNSLFGNFGDLVDCAAKAADYIAPPDDGPWDNAFEFFSAGTNCLQTGNEWGDAVANALGDEGAYPAGFLPGCVTGFFLDPIGG
jgi:RHS repeat-associated protein